MRGLFAVEPLYEGFQVRYTQSPIPTQQSITNLLFRYTDGLYLCYKYLLKLSKTLLVLHLCEHSLEKFLGVKLYY